MKILVVEDEHKIANSIKKGLEQESYVVDVAYDGEEGFDFASDNTYDAIILDLMLPKLNGIEFIKKIRQLGVHTPILILTAKGELDDKIEGLNTGADDYLVKPFAFAELLARINALSRRPKKIVESKFEVKDIELDSSDLSVKKSGTLINLSKKEYQVLEYLMKNKKRIVSKDEIISKVWDYDANILPNTVEVFVRFLRKKIGNNIIKTIRGFGYKIE